MDIKADRFRQRQPLPRHVFERFVGVSGAGAGSDLAPAAEGILSAWSSVSPYNNII